MLARTILLLAGVAVICGAAEQHGWVKSAGIPIPGATVTAEQSRRRVSTTTDENGAYSLPDLGAGAWTISVEMMGFVSQSKRLEIGYGAVELDWTLSLAPRQTRAAPPAAPAQNAAGPRAAAAYHRLQVTQLQAELQQAMNGPPAETTADRLSENANESFLVNGSLSRGLEAPQRLDVAFAMQQIQPGPAAGMPRGTFGAENAGAPAPGVFRGRGMGGPPGGFGTGGGRGGRAGRGAAIFGNRINRRREGFRGMASFSLRNSVLDAAPYAIGGQGALLKPSYAQSRFSVAGGGPLHIPKLLTDDNTFLFVSYFGTRARNPFSSFSTVPTPAERSGDFSASQTSATVFDPLSGQPFPGNVIPSSRIDPAAGTMLNLFPLPNLPGAVQNYQIVMSVPQNTDNAGVRINRNLGRNDRLAGAFNLQQRSGDNAQLFGFRDTSSGRGLNVNVAWTHNFSSTLINNARVYLTRNSSTLLPYFAFGADWASDLGIAGTSSNPVDFGPPNLSFTNFGALRDGSPSVQHNQTAGVNDGVIRIHGQHTISFGADYHRVALNSVSDANARGTYAFTGLATSGFDASGNPLAGTGFDFADFLLGLPNTSSIRFGSSDVYFRGSSYSTYIQDDWRVRGNLTLNIGARYEYLTPLHEKYGRMANLDVAPYFTSVAVVTPGSPGPYTGAFPDGLVNADPNNIAPRVGIAWKPFARRYTLVRAGYGVYYNGSVYNSAASRMAQQPPFADSSTINTSVDRMLTIANGFLAGATKAVTNTFAIDRFYRVGYAQTWNLALQQELPRSTILEVGYIGTKGTDLDIQRMPNRAAPGSPLTSEQRRLIGDAVGFIFDSSNGDSIYHAGQVRLARRFRGGISGNLLYTYSKSIDNASTIGGGAAVVVQNESDLAAERGLSSFDRRHTLNGSFLFSTSGAPGSAASRSVWLRDWQLSGGIALQSGSPFTAVVLGNLADAGGTGAFGSARADATGAPVTLAGALFNPAAFELPAPGRYGNAGRNTITGPALLSVNASFGRTIRFGEGRRNLDLRAEAYNLLNSVNMTSIGTTVNSALYGLPLAAGAMRSLNLTMRLRF